MAYYRAATAIIILPFCQWTWFTVPCSEGRAQELLVKEAYMMCSLECMVRLAGVAFHEVFTRAEGWVRGFLFAVVHRRAGLGANKRHLRT